MIEYSVIYFFNMFSSFLKSNQKKKCSIITFILLVLLSGTRYYIGGTDVYAYETYFNSAPSFLLLIKHILKIKYISNLPIEPGLLLIMSFVKFIGLNYFGFTLCISILFYFLLYKGMSNLIDDYTIVIAIFMYKIMFYNTFISIRQGITIAIFIYSLQYIINKNYIKYFFVSIVAFTFHRGAIFMFILYFLQYIPISKKIVIGVAGFFLPTILIRNYIKIDGILNVFTKIIGYEDKSKGYLISNDSISLIHTLELYIIIILIIYFFSKFDLSDKKTRLFIQMTIVLIPIFTLFSNWIVLTRIKDYLVICYGLIINNIIHNKKIGIKTRQTIKLAFFVLCFIGMSRYVLVFDNGNLMNYKSYLYYLESIFQ